MCAEFHKIKLDLAKGINGRVLDPGDSEYRASLAIDNGRVSLEPVAIVVPDAPAAGIGLASGESRTQLLVSDVVHTVNICRDAKLPLTVKSGGHGASGYCLNDGGVVLDLKNFNDVRLDRENGVLRVGAGQRFRRIYDYLELSGTGLIPVGGGCPTVGVGGFLLGGGYSFLSRSYGMGADNVSRFRVVTADGKLRDVGVHSEAADDLELFWGLRGGGGGNFGVLVDADIRCHRPPHSTLLVGNVLFPFHQLPEILDFYNDWITTLPDTMAVYGYLGSQPDPRLPGDQPLMLRLTPVFNGDFSEGIEHLRGLLALAPITTQLYCMTIHEWEDLIASGTEVKGRSAYMKSVILRRGEMTGSVIKTLMRYMNRRPSSDSFIVWTHAGGAISKVADDATAYPHRDAELVVEVKAIWRSERPEDMRPNVEWACDFFEALADDTFGGAYINYIDPLQRDWRKSYYGGNFDRLLKLKKSVDPKSFFSFQQSLDSQFDPKLTRPLNLAPLFKTMNS